VPPRCAERMAAADSLKYFMAEWAVTKSQD
jgi:hypothetical protein